MSEKECRYDQLQRSGQSELSEDQLWQHIKECSTCSVSLLNHYNMVLLTKGITEEIEVSDFTTHEDEISKFFSLSFSSRKLWCFSDYHSLSDRLSTILATPKVSKLLLHVLRSMHRSIAIGSQLDEHPMLSAITQNEADLLRKRLQNLLESMGSDLFVFCFDPSIGTIDPMEPSKSPDDIINETIHNTSVILRITGLQDDSPDPISNRL